MKTTGAWRRHIAVTASLLAGWAGFVRGQATFAGLGLPSNTIQSVVTQVSADGNNAVGFVVSTPDDWHGCQKQEAFRWTLSGGLTRFAIPPNALVQRSLGVSGNGGVMVGELVTPFADGTFSSELEEIEGLVRPFRWAPSGGLEWLPVPDGSENTAAVAVSADGAKVVGYMDSEDGYQACHWTTAGGLQGLGFLPGGIESRALAVSSNGSVIAGYSHGTEGIRAFRWTAAGGMQNLGLLTNGAISRAAGMSADGAVVVGVVEGNGQDKEDKRAFRWTAPQGMVELVAPAGTDEATAMAVSADGNIVVGLMTDTNACTRAFIWDQTNGMRSVKSVLTSAGVDIGTWLLSMAMGVSADGRVVVGTGANPERKVESWRAMLPAP
jgi:probable HAF family extracellular repeat protein